MLERHGGGDLTRLLRTWAAGDRTIEYELFNLVLPHLKRVARALLSKERRCSWQATELVKEVYSALVRAKGRDWRWESA